MSFRNKGTTGPTVIVSREPDYSGNYVCNGVNDDVEIQAALDYVEVRGGGTVLVRRGGSVATRYDITVKLEIGSFTTLRGDGITAFDQSVTTFFLAAGVNDDMITNKAGAEAVGIRNLYLIGNKANQAAGSAINIDAIQSEIAFNHINDFKVNGVIINGGQTHVYRNFFDNIDQDAIQLLGADSYVYNNECFGTRYGIYINAGSNHVSENNVFLCGSHGIFGDTGSDQSIISDNRVNDCTGLGIDSVGSNNIVADTRCVLNVGGGIRIRSFDHVVSDNNCWENGGVGIQLTGSAQRSSVTGNVVRENDGHGIELVDQEHVTVTGNVTMNNGQGGGASAGIFVFFNSSSRYIVISGNICSDDQSGVETQDYGVRVDTGVTDVSIVDNVCEGNDQFGVWVETGASDIIVKNNLLLNNGTAAIQDAGTDTAVHHTPVHVSDPDSSVGDHPALVLPDTVDTTFRFQVQIPLGFQELVTAQVIVVQTATGGPPDMQWSTTTDWGKLCAGENYNNGSDAETDQITAVAQNELVCIDVSASLTGIAAGDLVGFTFIRRASQAGDTINADAHYLGFRLRFV